MYNTAANIQEGLRKGADNKVLRNKFSLNWTEPFKIIAVGPSSAADTPDGRPLRDELLYIDFPSNLSGPATKPRVTVVRCSANPYDADGMPKSLPTGLTQYVVHAFATKLRPYHITTDDVSTPPNLDRCRQNNRSPVCARPRRVPSLSCTRHTGTESCVPHGNASLIFKPFATTSSYTGQMGQPVTSPKLDSINSCVSTRLRARSFAPKVNATSRSPTDS